MGENTKDFTKQEIDNGKGMAILSYFGILALIPYFAEKKNKFARFHAIAGMNLMLVWIAYAIINGIVTGIVTAATIGSCVSSIYSYSSSASAAACAASGAATGIVSLIFGIIGLLIGIVAIIGIVNAATGKAKEVPILGKIRIIKK